MRRPPIRWRLTVWYGAALAAILLLFSAATYWRYRAAAWKAFETDLSMNLDTLQSELVEELEEVRAETVSAPGGSRAQASDADPRTRAAKQALEDFRLNGLYTEVREGRGGQVVLARMPGGDLGRSGRVLPESSWQNAADEPATRFVSVGSDARAAVRGFRPSPDSEPLLIAVAERTALVDDMLSSIRRSLLEFGTAGLILALAGGYWLARRALEPIDAMTTQAGRMASVGSPEGVRRLDVINPEDELGRLAQTFNALLERIESSVSQMRGFVADAAHELKTPVSVVRAEAELSLSSDRSPDDYRDALGAIARESAQLSHLVSDLTLLAEGETLKSPLERRLVDLNELIHEVARSLRVFASDRGVVVEIDSSGGAEYRGDERLLRRVVTNLLENAIKFSRAPGRIGVVLSEEPASIELRILDEAPTLSEEDRERVFERFYRAQHSRSSEATGSGLGLAIVRWAVALHGGRIHIEPRTGAGNAFVVTLPLSPDSLAASERTVEVAV